MVKERLGWNKVLFSSQRGRTANDSIHQNAGSSTLPAPGRQISGLLPASGFIENQTDSDSSLSPHLARFVARLFAGCPRFRLKGSVGLIVGLAIASAVLIAGEGLYGP